MGGLASLVEEYCASSSEDCDLLLFENFWAKGAVGLQTNQFEQGFRSFRRVYEVLQDAIRKGSMTLPDTRQALACGLMGNGCMAMNRYEEAEQWYLQAFQMWDELPEVSKDKQLYVRALQITSRDILMIVTGFEYGKLSVPTRKA